MKTIGILGCGWLGLHLSQYLLNKNYRIKGSTTSSTKLQELKEKGIEPYLVDLQNPDAEQIDAFLQTIDVLVITIPPIRGEESSLYKQSFEHLLPSLAQNNIKKIIMMSSVSVYQPSEDSITETSTKYSNDSTSRQILDAENVLLSQEGLTSCIMRLGGLFGPDRKPVRYIVNRGILDNPALPINMIHIKDIVQFTEAILTHEFSSNEIYNLVSPLYENRLAYYTKEAEELDLILPPLGENDWKTNRKIIGEKIVHKTGINYHIA